MIYLDDITGVLGKWLDSDFDEEVPYDVIEAIQSAYDLAIKGGMSDLCQK